MSYEVSDFRPIPGTSFTTFTLNANPDKKGDQAWHFGYIPNILKKNGKEVVIKPFHYTNVECLVGAESIALQNRIVVIEKRIDGIYLRAHECWRKTFFKPVFHIYLKSKNETIPLSPIKCFVSCSDNGYERFKRIYEVFLGITHKIIVAYKSKVDTN